MSDFNCPTFQKNDIQLLKTGNLADGTIKCNGRTWKVHRILLASRLQFFKAAFYGDFSVGSSPRTTINVANTNWTGRNLWRGQFP